MLYVDYPGALSHLKDAFGRDITIDAPLSASGAGLRIEGVDLAELPTPAQAKALFEALAFFRIVTLPGQDLNRLGLGRFEQFANLWGAPVPHPNNFLRGGKPAQSDGVSSGTIEYLPTHQRTAAAVDAAFPGRIRCLEHESPAVLVVTNFRGNPDRPGTPPLRPRQVIGGGSWHTDIEYEPVPIYVSMFLVHQVPTTPDWVGQDAAVHDAPDIAGSSDELTMRRKNLPRNGATAFADTAAAFGALPPSEQAALRRVQVRRRLNADDPGWLAPIVRRNPLSAIESLHSPIWASRPGVRPPVTIDDMSEARCRAFLDELETHTLDPRFRYDHRHKAGDVTIWHNYMTLHTAPPMWVSIDDPVDARLMYRISCKGQPSAALPRRDSPAWLDRHVTDGYRTPGANVAPE